MFGVISIFKQEDVFKEINSSFLEKEQRRLNELYSLNLIGTPEEESFDQITNLASRLFQVPISLISLITEDKQWFKSCVGLPDDLKESRSTERSAAFCQYVVADGNALVIEDTLLNEKLRDNPLVKEYNIRFYAGAPIITKQNNVLGTLCIVDTKPRKFSEGDLKVLIDLTNWVKAEIELKADLIEKTISERSIRTLHEVTSDKDITFQEKLKKLILLGCERFQFPNGFVIRAENKDFEVLEAISEEEFLTNKDAINLSDRFVLKATSAKEPIYLKEDRELRVNGISLKEYIGAPIIINNKHYGTFCFFTERIKDRKISDSDLEFLQLMAQWIGNEIERIQSQTKLIDSQERFQQIANNIKEAFWMFDLQENKLLYMSAAWFHISGQTLEDYNRDLLVFFNAIHPDDRESTLHHFKNVTDSKEFEYRLFHSNGLIKWIRTKIVPINNREGIVTRLAGVAEDITESKRNENLLRKSDKLAAVGQLAASIAHEIRNPLTSIKGFMQLVTDAKFPYRDIVLTELDQIETFIKEILMLAKPHHEVKQEEKEVYLLIQEAIQTIHLRDSFNLTISLEDNDQSFLILCDEIQMRQVFYNIIENAAEAMPSGGEIKIRIGKQDEDSCFILIEDQGVGITEDRIAKLGEPFYSNKEKGSGLGLMISYKIIQNHKGNIDFASEPGKGTKVKIVLPIVV